MRVARIDSLADAVADGQLAPAASERASTR